MTKLSAAMEAALHQIATCEIGRGYLKVGVRHRATELALIRRGYLRVEGDEIWSAYYSSWRLYLTETGWAWMAEHRPDAIRGYIREMRRLEASWAPRSTAESQLWAARAEAAELRQAITFKALEA